MVLGPTFGVTLQLDRGDTFLYFLNKFYYEDDEEILEASTKINKKTLKEYLKSNFHDVYDYSDKMLQIDDENFINKFIKNVEKKLDSTLVNDYLDMAIRFCGKMKRKNRSNDRLIIMSNLSF